MQLHDALEQIAEIRAQVARTQVFRGYRSVTTAFSAVVAGVTAALQAAFLPEPALHPNAYLLLWIGAAALCLGAVTIEVLLRARRQPSPLQVQLALLALEQFVPCVVAGGLLAYVFWAHVPQALWMLPGLWLMLFGLGVFASCRVLPRATFWIGAYYLFAGVLALILAQSANALSPWAMGAGFGIGQVLTSVLLYYTLERAAMGIEDKAAGRFAYDGLERVIHEKARLSIMSSLAAHADGLLFNDLKELCVLTDGNLSRHLQLLQESKLVEVWKGTKNQRPQTLVRLTLAGRARFLEYIAELERVIADAMRPTGAAATAVSPARIATA